MVLSITKPLLINSIHTRTAIFVIMDNSGMGLAIEIKEQAALPIENAASFLLAHNKHITRSVACNVFRNTPN